MGRNIYIGDVHGCLDELVSLVKLVGVGPDDTVYLTGDFFDRGPDPIGCVRYARARGFQAVLGNHDERHLRWRRYVDAKAADPSRVNPMQMPPDAAAANAALNAADLAWLQAIPLTRVVDETWVVVHAGLFPGKTLSEQFADGYMRDKLNRIRHVDTDGKFVPLRDEDPGVPATGRPWSEVYDGPFNVVYGHAIHNSNRPRIDVRPQGVVTYGIDTGCCYGGHLTALISHRDRVEFAQVKARRAYATPRQPLPV